MALKAEGYGFSVFDDWSRPASNYGGTASAWKSFTGSGITGGYLVAMATAAGWQPEQLTGEYLERA